MSATDRSPINDLVILTLLAKKMYLPQSVQSAEKEPTYPVNQESSKSRNYSFFVTLRMLAFLLKDS
jgi:hypothetical protein